jgi:hypothetical protein
MSQAFRRVCITLADAGKYTVECGMPRREAVVVRQCVDVLTLKYLLSCDTIHIDPDDARLGCF